jgi:hypothetical protein
MTSENQMPFHEKSAWIMTLALLLGGVFYFGVVAAMSSQLGRLAPPVLPLIAVYSAVLAAIAAIGHVVIAALAPRDTGDRLDERERQVIVRAGHGSGYVLAAGVVVSLGLYLVRYDGHLLFYGVFASLMLAQLAEYVMQIVRLRGHG